MDLIRSFVPEYILFGSDECMSDGIWRTELDGSKTTYFKSDDLIVKLILSYNANWNCTEVSFKTVIANKVQNLQEAGIYASYLPDPELSVAPDRGTYIFRRVIYVMSTKFEELDCFGFNGATQFLDRIYGRLDRLGYLLKYVSQFGYTVSKTGRDLKVYR